MKSYHTPLVPRKHARLQVFWNISTLSNILAPARLFCKFLLFQTQSVSTPNPKETAPVSIKEQIKSNFGFTDSEDEGAG